MRPIPPVDFHTFFFFFSSGIVSLSLLWKENYTRTYPRYARLSISRFHSSLSFLFFSFLFFFSFGRRKGRGSKNLSLSLSPASLKFKAALFEFIPPVIWSERESEGAANRPFSSKGNNARARAGNDLWRSTGSEEKARDTWMGRGERGFGVREAPFVAARTRGG